MKLKFGDPIEVTWVDACSCSSWQMPYEDGALITNVGLFVSQNEKGLCLARGIDRENRDTVLAPGFIPKGIIKKIRRLR